LIDIDAAPTIDEFSTTQFVAEPHIRVSRKPGSRWNNWGVSSGIRKTQPGRT
jgi:hypothetical protein